MLTCIECMYVTVSSRENQYHNGFRDTDFGDISM